MLALALLSVAGLDARGWIATASVWTEPGAALAPVSKAFAGIERRRVACPHLALLVVLSAGAYALGEAAKQFAIAFTLVFAIAWELVPSAAGRDSPQ